MATRVGGKSLLASDTSEETRWPAQEMLPLYRDVEIPDTREDEMRMLRYIAHRMVAEASAKRQRSSE